MFYDQRLALKRLIDVSMGVITPLSEQLTKPLPHAIVLLNSKELSTGAYKLLPEGTALLQVFEFELIDIMSVLQSRHVLPVI